MKKNLPKLKTNKQAKNFIKKDISEFISAVNFKPVTFELAPKDKAVTLRMSQTLLKNVKVLAKKRGVSYQKIIRLAIEKIINEDAA